MITMEGIAQECATFQTSSSLNPGIPCKLIAKMLVAPCQDGDEFIGVAARQEGALCSVIFRGFVTLHFSGTAPTYGYVGLAADGAGGVKVSATAVKRLVVAVSTVSKTITLLL